MREIVIELTAEQAAQLKDLRPDDVVRISGAGPEGAALGALLGNDVGGPIGTIVGAYLGDRLQDGFSSLSSDIGGRQVSEIVAP